MLIITSAIVLSILLYVALILFFLSGWWKLREYVPGKKTSRTKVTVVIPARNEEKNIINLLNDLRDQQYHRDLFEILVVDNFSSDRTVELVKQLNASNIKIISLADFFPNKQALRANKKAGIQMAIEQATGELIVTTDADCHVGNNWLNTIVQYYEEHDPVMIAGLVSYYPDSSFLGKFQTLDFLSLVGIGAACIQHGFYNLCNGANLAYKKSVFMEVGGFKDIDHIPSGDDMMLMHKMAKNNKGRIACLKNKESIVYTNTEKDFIPFWNQRVRWTSKSAHYEDKRITLLLAFVYLFNVLIVADLLIGFFYAPFLKLAMFQFLAKLCIDTLFAYSIAKYFRRENLLWLFLPVQILHILYIILVAPAGVFGKYYWKGRRI